MAIDCHDAIHDPAATPAPWLAATYTCDTASKIYSYASGALKGD